MTTSFNGHSYLYDPLLDALARGQEVDYDVLREGVAYRHHLLGRVGALQWGALVQGDDLPDLVRQYLRLEISLLDSASVRLAVRRAA